MEKLKIGNKLNLGFGVIMVLSLITSVTTIILLNNI